MVMLDREDAGRVLGNREKASDGRIRKTACFQIIAENGRLAEVLAGTAERNCGTTILIFIRCVSGDDAEAAGNRGAAGVQLAMGSIEQSCVDGGAGRRRWKTERGRRGRKIAAWMLTNFLGHLLRRRNDGESRSAVGRGNNWSGKNILF